MMNEAPRPADNPMWDQAIQMFMQKYGHEPATDMEMQETEAMMMELGGQTSRPAMENNVLQQMGEDPMPPTGGVEDQYPGDERRQDAAMDEMGMPAGGRNYAGPQGDGTDAASMLKEITGTDWDSDFTEYLDEVADPAKVQEFYKRIR